MLIHHRFAHRLLSKTARIVLVGTFNPETPENTADFFYGRVQNHLWTLLPGAFGHSSLKKKGKEEKEQFMHRYKIEFTDVITTVEVEKPDDYRDDYIDGCVVEWTDVIGQLQELPDLEKVCVTRKSFSGIPHIRKRLQEIESYCHEHGICFHYLITPARGYTAAKQVEWDAFFKGSLHKSSPFIPSKG